ncbi:MAG: hypothetical protein LBK95_09075 [Bifidobacteriaceae bacterium]|nr:hypothetical protein [Bifidobacteriaceae bacterium]
MARIARAGFDDDDLAAHAGAVAVMELAAKAGQALNVEPRDLGCGCINSGLDG